MMSLQRKSKTTAVIALGRNLLLQFRHFRRPWRSVAGAVRAERSDVRTAGSR